MKNVLINIGYAILCVLAIIAIAAVVEFLFTHYATITFTALILGVLFFMCYMFVSIVRDR